MDMKNHQNLNEGVKVSEGDKEKINQKEILLNFQLRVRDMKGDSWNISAKKDPSLRQMHP